jgi:hypothetical protein
MSLTTFMTATCEHRNNTTGAASTSSVATGIACAPIDPATKAPSQDYPTEKFYLLKETFMKYAAFRTGDFLVSGGITYSVLAAWPWAAQGGLDSYVHLVLEEKALDG